jgi:nucleotide-binding universal stress UspA family protein
MDTIIVAIDFSKTSIHALEYAIFLANQMKTHVMMVWVDNQSTPESIFSEDSAELREEAKRNLDELMARYGQSLKNGDLTFKIRKGKVYTEISQLARQLEARLVITGTHGVTGFEEYWIGSNAYRIVINSPCPVITVRNQYDFSNGIRNIVLPIDETRSTCQKVPFTVHFARIFGATVHILAFYSTTLKALHNKVDNCIAEVKKQLDMQGIRNTVESMVAENVSLATIDYSNKVNAELVAIMTEQETTASNILLGQYAQQMVNYSNVPVLSIHPGEIFTA